MAKFARCIALIAAFAASASPLWAQTQKPNQPAQAVPQTQRPAPPPVQTQQLPAQPQTQRPQGSAQSAPGRPAEMFMMPMPKGWKQVSADEHYNIRTIQYAPDGKNPDKSEEMLRSMVFSYVRDAPLDEFLALATRVPKDECQDVMSTPPVKGLVNGYESVFITRFCTKNKKSGQGEVAMFKLIQGKTGMYIGERIWRMKPFGKDKPPVTKEVFEGWTDYMKAVTVCVVDDPVRPCPKGAQ